MPVQCTEDAVDLTLVEMGPTPARQGSQNEFQNPWIWTEKKNIPCINLYLHVDSSNTDVSCKLFATWLFVCHVSLFCGFIYFFLLDGNCLKISFHFSKTLVTPRVIMRILFKMLLVWWGCRRKYNLKICWSYRFRVRRVQESLICYKQYNIQSDQLFCLSPKDLAITSSCYGYECIVFILDHLRCM